MLTWTADSVSMVCTDLLFLKKNAYSQALAPSSLGQLAWCPPDPTLRAMVYLMLIPGCLHPALPRRERGTLTVLKDLGFGTQCSDGLLLY